MNSPIVHIGYHKTATSWFQKAFYPFVKNASYIDRKRVKELFLNPTALRFDPEKVQKEFSPVARPIICEEDLCGYFENSGLLEALSKEVASRIKGVFPKAQIVIFIRNQLEMIRASYMQYLRTGGSCSIRKFLFPYSYHRKLRKRTYNYPLFTLDHLCYQYLIRHYQNLFGNKNVHVFCYEDFSKNPKEFAKKFAQIFDLEVDLEELDFSYYNYSLGKNTLYLAKLLGPFTHWNLPGRFQILPAIPKGVTKKYILPAFNKLFIAGKPTSTRELLGEKLYNELYEYFLEENEELAKETGLPLEEFGYPITYY